MERDIRTVCDTARDFDFGRMLLPVGETYSLDSFKLLLCPKQASGGILSTGEANHSGISFFLH